MGRDSFNSMWVHLRMHSEERLQFYAVQNVPCGLKSASAKIFGSPITPFVIKVPSVQRNEMLDPLSAFCGSKCK